MASVVLHQIKSNKTLLYLLLLLFFSEHAFWLKKKSGEIEMYKINRVFKRSFSGYLLKLWNL